MCNKVRSKGSIVKAYVTTECFTFFSMYLDDIEIRFNCTNRNVDREQGDNEPMLSIFKQTIQSIGGRRYEFMDVNKLSKAYFYVLNNCEEIKDFIE